MAEAMTSARSSERLLQQRGPINAVRKVIQQTKRGKGATTRHSKVTYSSGVEASVVRACIRDTKELRDHSNLEELIGKSVTHLVIEDEEQNLKTIPEGISKIHTLRSFLLTWSKIKVLPEYFLQMELEELFLKKCPLKSIDGIHYMQSLVILELENTGLKTVPSEIGDMASLEQLRLNGNCLKDLPNTIGKLEMLTALEVCGNSLAALPLSIGGLGQLETLDASQNRIKVVPETFGSLRSLVTLRLSHNQISSLPGTLRELGDLRHLFLSSNRFTETPLVVAHLQDLQTLSLVSNKINSVSSSLPNLTTLLLKNNCLEELPGTLLGFVNLQKLAIQYNGLTFIPPSIERLTCLRALYLAGNDITELPDEICNMKELRHLDISETDIEDLPEYFDSLTQLTMLDVDGSSLGQDYIHALTIKGIPSLMQFIQSKRSLSAMVGEDVENDMEDLYGETTESTNEQLTEARHTEATDRKKQEPLAQNTQIWHDDNLTRAPRKAAIQNIDTPRTPQGRSPVPQNKGSPVVPSVRNQGSPREVRGTDVKPAPKQKVPPKTGPKPPTKPKPN